VGEDALAARIELLGRRFDVGARLGHLAMDDAAGTLVVPRTLGLLALEGELVDAVLERGDPVDGVAFLPPPGGEPVELGLPLGDLLPGDLGPLLRVLVLSVPDADSS